MIKNIIFDCSDTLLHYELIEAFTNHLNGNADLAKRIADAVGGSAAFRRYAVGTLDYEQARAQALALLDECDRKHGEWYLDERYLHYRDIDGMYDLVKRLKDNGYNLYILSDFPDYFEYLWENFKIFRLFDGRCVSYEAHASKKDGLLFESIIYRYNLDVSECVFVDDHAENAMMGFSYGMKGIRFTDAKDTEQRLREFGVNI